MSDRTLVVLGGSITGLAAVREAARRGYSVVLVAESNEVALSSRFGRKLVCGPESDQEALRLLDDIGNARSANLLATSDAWLRFIQRNKAALVERFAQILHPGEDSLAICTDKARFSKWCAEHDIPSPRSYSASSALEAGDDICPLIIRPTSSSHDGGHTVEKAAHVSSIDELERHLARLHDARFGAIITQSLLNRNLEQYSVGFVRRHDASIASIVLMKRRPTALACDCGTFVEWVSEPEVQMLAEAVANELRYFGIGEVEILRDASTGECFVIEVNARPWLQFGLVASAGYDWLTFLLNPGAYRPPTTERRPRAWLSFADDLFVCFSRSVGEVRNGRIGLRAYLLSFARVRVFAIWALGDIRPVFHVLRRQLGFSSG